MTPSRPRIDRLKWGCYHPRVRCIVIVAGLLLTGCVERLIIVRSEPPATVILDEKKVGITPVEIPYTWYGKRELTLELKGFKRIREIIVLNAPWWQFFPLDFVTDVLLPFKLTDHVTFDYMLEPLPPPEDEREGVLRRAAEMREKAGVPK